MPYKLTCEDPLVFDEEAQVKYKFQSCIAIGKGIKSFQSINLSETVLKDKTIKRRSATGVTTCATSARTAGDAHKLIISIEYSDAHSLMIICNCHSQKLNKARHA